MYKQDDYERLKRRLAIDSMMMDEELVQHPSTLQEVNEFTADCMHRRDMAKNDYDVILAEAAARLRVAGEDGKMPSEAKINSMAPLDKKVLRASEDLENIRRDTAYWQGLSGAMQAKGSALKHISELILAGWLAPNTVRRREVAEKRNETGGTKKTFTKA